MDLLNTYIEMMGDMEFAIYVAMFVFGLIFLIGLLGKLAERKAVPVSIAEPKAEPKPMEEKTKDVKIKIEEVKVKEKEPVSLPVSPAVPPPVLEGVMTWEFDDGKKKKNKKISAAPIKSTAVTPPPAPVATPAVPSSAEKPPVSEKIVSAPPPPPPLPETRPEDKTVILPPKEVLKTVPAPVAPPAVTGSPAKVEDLAPPEKSFVDFQMYETLIRRIAGLEADLKRDPLYLDPLLKRVGLTEKRVEELATKGVAVAAPAGHGDPSGGTAEGEVKELREKVLKLEKLLEHLSEGPSADAPENTSNFP